jgi:hypothetical protein
VIPNWTSSHPMGMTTRTTAPTGHEGIVRSNVDTNLIPPLPVANKPSSVLLKSIIPATSKPPTHYLSRKYTPRVICSRTRKPTCNPASVMDEVRCLVLERRMGRAASLRCHLLLHVLIERSVLLYLIHINDTRGYYNCLCVSVCLCVCLCIPPLQS